MLTTDVTIHRYVALAFSLRNSIIEPAARLHRQVGCDSHSRYEQLLQRFRTKGGVSRLIGEVGRSVV